MTARRPLAALMLTAVLALAACETPTAVAPTPAAPDIPVRQAQAGLATLGYRVGPVDGILGPRTEAAIERFRTREELGEAAHDSGIDEPFADRLAERLAFEGVTLRRRARSAEARRVLVPQPVAARREDDALDALLTEWEARVEADE
ncbi:MAG: peptidoglycan-binding domain-containing protein [Pseudomonadota bacterium]